MHKFLKLRAQVIFRGKFNNGQAFALADAEPLFRVIHLRTVHKGECHLIQPKGTGLEADQSGDGGTEDGVPEVFGR